MPLPQKLRRSGNFNNGTTPIAFISIELEGGNDLARRSGAGGPGPLSGTLVIQQTNLGPLLGRLLGPLLGLAATFVTTHFRFHDAATAARC